MTSKELRKLSKDELVDKIIDLEAVIEKLQVRVEEMQDQLADRTVKIEQAGNLAEAAIQVNGVIEAAQKAADQYLKNIESLNEKTTALCLLQEEECNAKCYQMEADAKKNCKEMLAAAKLKCETLEKETNDKIDNRWTEFKNKVDRYITAHGELKQILGSTIEK